MEKTFCDICGVEMKKRNYYIYRIMHEKPGLDMCDFAVSSHLDVCQDCTEKFIIKENRVNQGK